jgi:DNA modification methylase
MAGIAGMVCCSTGGNTTRAVPSGRRAGAALDPLRTGMMGSASTLHLGDCLEVLRTLPDASVDAVVTDPPYGLAFMGKRWDYDVPTVEVWAECLRVLKPGGHLLAFAGTRTQHRMAVRIEDAGFEIRDMIAWVYGSGFPKSLDVSKAIDRMDASEEQQRRRLRFTAWVRGTGATSRQINEATGTNMGGHYTTHLTQPAIMTRKHLEQCRHLLGDVPEWVEREADIRSVESRNMASREVVGQGWRIDRKENAVNYGGGTPDGTYAITAPATPAAQQWHGWGTALKPSLEPVTVARKPFKGGVGANVLAHGTGGINVDGCRVGMPEDATGRMFSGRWPANLIHDGSEEPCALLGDAARFFYTAKASRDDRSDGNTHPTVKPTDLMRYLCRLVTPPGGIVLDPFMGSGSTGKAAMLEGFDFIGIEREAAYHAIAERRIRQAAAAGHQSTLF